ncbi:MAG: hypothetical protein AB7P49_20815 [Bdellovibrionales bacterium]
MGIHPPSLPQSLQTSWSAFLGEEGISPEFKVAMDNSTQRYSQAIDVLARKSGECRGKAADLTWYDRAIAKFGVAEIQKHKKDFSRAIASKYIETWKRCLEGAEKDALYAEFQLLPFLGRNLELLTAYSQRLNQTQRDLIKPLINHLTQIQNAHPTPLQVLLNPMLELQRIERRNTVKPAVWQFVSKDPAFQKPFALGKAVEPLQGKTK